MVKILLFILIFLSALTFSNKLFSQSDSTKYTASFNFAEGIYKSYKEFKENDPSIREKAVISNNPETQFLVGNFATMENIFYYDSKGISQRLSRTEVWGYSSNGAIYIMLNNNFHRIHKIGRIIHLTESHNTVLYRSSVPVSAINKPVRLIQYLIDFNTGEILRYNLENFILLLKTDKELYDEFLSIKSNKKQEEQMFIYLNKFNQRNPIYFKTDKS